MQLQPNPPASAINRKIRGNGSFLLAYQLKGKHCLIIGGGREAANRTFFALDASAQVTVIAPGPRHPAVQHRIDSGLAVGVDRQFMDSDLTTSFAEFSGQERLEEEGKHAVDMVLVCIDDHAESRRIATLARKLRIPVNCADIPDLCDFYFMAQYRDQDLQIAVSTNGGGPRLGARIRNEIVAKLNPNTPLAVSCVGSVRAAIRTIDRIENKDDSSNLDTLKSRMGWISRFCDSWTFDELAALDNEIVMENVLDSFRKGAKAPSPPILSASSSGRTLYNLPAQLTSFWWCPSAMGYASWLKMGFRFMLAVGGQIFYLLNLHLKLLITEVTNSMIYSLKTEKMEVVGDAQKSDKLDELLNSSIIDQDEKTVVESTLLVSNRIEKPTKNGSLNNSAKTNESLTLGHSTQPDLSKCSIGVQCKPDSVEYGQQNEVSAESSFSQTDIKLMASTEALKESTVTATVQDNAQNPSLGLNLAEMFAMDTRLESNSFREKKTGALYLVGAGPGHPELLTIQAVKILMACDLVVSDRLVPQELLDLISPEKLVLSSFKVGGASDKSQDETNEICLKAVKEGKTVARFKTGDPFVYGRAGEEILFFRKYNIEAIVAPGLSSVFGACSFNSIPVTHRGVADQVLLLSGRGQGGTFPNIPWYDPMRTTIFLMSLSRLEELSKLMIEKGYPSDLECAVIQKGTWINDEKLSFSNLKGVAAQVVIDGIENPAMLIVGSVTSVLYPRPIVSTPI